MLAGASLHPREGTMSSDGPVVSGDPRMSADGPTRWAAARATKTRCRHCYEDIVQLRPDDRWRDIESECATCAPNLYHEPLTPT
jgi:hypothetical protein